MNENKKQAQKEAKMTEKRLKEDAESLAREQKIKQTYLVKEEALQKETKTKEAERENKRAVENKKELEKEKSRKEAYLANEKKIALDRESRNQKNKR
jgi:hypothetical protein